MKIIIKILGKFKDASSLCEALGMTLPTLRTEDDKVKPFLKYFIIQLPRWRLVSS